MPRLTKDRVTAFLVILPSIILIAIFVYGFIAQTAYTAMTDWGNNPDAASLAENSQVNFVGLKNFQDLFTKSYVETGGVTAFRFRGDIVNTIFFTLLFLAVCLGIGLLMSILIDQKIKGESVFRTIFLFPMALSFVVTGTVWRWLYYPSGGLNVLPALLGLPASSFRWQNDRSQLFTFSWPDGLRIIAAVVFIIFMFITGEALRLGRRGLAILFAAAGFLISALIVVSTFSLPPFMNAEKYGLNTALVAIVIAASWQMSGYTMAMYLAGLRGISEELREAARVDGCNEWQVYRFIIFPLLQPITLSAVIILGHISLKIFDLVYVINGAQENLQIDVPGVTMYLTAFRGNNFAIGAAIAFIMLLMVAVIIVPYLINQFRSEVHV